MKLKKADASTGLLITFARRALEHGGGSFESRCPALITITLTRLALGFEKSLIFVRKAVIPFAEVAATGRVPPYVLAGPKAGLNRIVFALGDVHRPFAFRASWPMIQAGLCDHGAADQFLHKPLCAAEWMRKVRHAVPASDEHPAGIHLTSFINVRHPGRPDDDPKFARAINESDFASVAAARTAQEFPQGPVNHEPRFLLETGGNQRLTDAQKIVQIRQYLFRQAAPPLNCIFATLR
mgnify:CR=1 FL=1